ncbi:hypothetical protein EVAR_47247_1 [Eumeta japonica]|uniref:Reverse transcriptase domain-containing protein n=1 Tax=Eumeta variegata TaxID=151549 RepID=A0A4C1XH92_EUMVA|nr:hypothetical protein EVAR_47247_1 [Eumeta japonica]
MSWLDRYNTTITQYGREVAASAAGFRPVCESSGGTFHYFVHLSARSSSIAQSPSIGYSIPSQEAGYSLGCQTGIYSFTVLFNLFLDCCLHNLKEYECGLRMDVPVLKCVLYADDQTILAPSACELLEMVTKSNDSVLRREKADTALTTPLGRQYPWPAVAICYSLVACMPTRAADQRGRPGNVHLRIAMTTRGRGRGEGEVCDPKALKSLHPVLL